MEQKSGPNVFWREKCGSSGTSFNRLFLRDIRKDTNLLARYFEKYAGHFNTSFAFLILNWRNISQTTQFCQGIGSGGFLKAPGVNVIVIYFNKCKLVLTCVVKFKSNLTVDWKRVNVFRSGGYNRRNCFVIYRGGMTASKILRRIFDTSVNKTSVP